MQSNASASEPRQHNNEFTLRSHCGGWSTSLQKCLSDAGLSTDPMAVDAGGWDRAPDCERLWLAYRSCGREFITSVTSVRCSEEVKRYNECTRDGSKRTALEADALWCLSSKIKLRMTTSGKQFPFGSEPESRDRE
uniref:Uncharacterized protein n=1 Tax=Prymnesium polylepis TaxID=72548 RepID=A0A7S4ISH2_9EUKA